MFGILEVAVHLALCSCIVAMRIEYIIEAVYDQVEVGSCGEQLLGESHGIVETGFVAASERDESLGRDVGTIICCHSPIIKSAINPTFFVLGDTRDTRCLL